MKKHPYHMTRAELDALPPAERAEAQRLINDVIFGDAADRQYLAGDYQTHGTRRAHEWGQ